jgi:endonuclease YncB( thermonuclease family)
MKTASSLVLALLMSTANAQAGRAPTQKITDGDTFRFGREIIRIANIDAPETYRAKCTFERRLGLQAKDRLTQLLASGKVAFKRGDPQDGRLKDRNGRTLATVTVNGKDVGEILIAEGLARRWTGRRQPWCR